MKTEGVLDMKSEPVVFGSTIHLARLCKVNTDTARSWVKDFQETFRNSSHSLNFAIKIISDVSYIFPIHNKSTDMTQDFTAAGNFYC